MPRFSLPPLVSFHYAGKQWIGWFGLTLCRIHHHYRVKSKYHECIAVVRSRKIHPLVDNQVAVIEGNKAIEVDLSGNNRQDTMSTTAKTMIGEYSEDHLLGVAKDVVAKKTQNSKLLDAAAEARIPKFHPSGETNT